MTNFEKIKNMNQAELAEWLLIYGIVDDAPWDLWYNKTYCENCESIDMSEITGHFTEEAYCEHYSKCKFFQKDMLPIDVIRLWLEVNYES